MKQTLKVYSKVISTVNHESQYHNKKSSGQVAVGCWPRSEFTGRLARVL